jgi:pimeloyl-ACP methyl ester carboxylesterase
VSEASITRVTATDGSPLAVHVLGAGRALVCVPGGPGRASAYLEDLAGLSQSRRLIRIDMRGTGFSPLPDDRSSLAFPRLADDVDDVRAAHDLEQFDLLAHSAGCLVAMVYAVRHPDRVSRLVLVTPSARGFGQEPSDVPAIRAGRRDEPWYAEVTALEAQLAEIPEERRGRMDAGLRPYYYARWDERVQEHAARTDSQMSLRAMAAFVPPAEDLAALDLRGRLGALRVPTLVVVGKQDGLTGVQAGHTVAEAIPGARVAELDDAGHFPWVDAPDHFRRTVLGFLDSR